MILDIKELLKKILNALKVDYIIEENTVTTADGHWTYRKWKSGEVELWGKYGKALTNYSSGALGGYGYYTNIPLPFDVYLPVINYSVMVGTGFAVPASAMGYATSSPISSFNVYAIATASGQQLTAWVIDVRGRWKAV